ncbi:hypothetical protein [Persicirhabdus sediminis]|uniref:MetA-pathway of phenol degradation n=1 Tax=Persicirhabdus sediminis TaxID=454144 RepID=A0A8J7SMJ4_9BACT|nr:hypothetical protein [Persicirhabdus sediminis]MBK1791133.1 hypothetical protein [Persicirhabdus sediminis]
MKAFLSLTALSTALLLPASAEIDSEIPIGIEALTGYRSQYVNRGFILTDSMLEAQLDTRVSLNDRTTLSFAASYGTGTGSNDFAEGAGFLDLSYECTEVLSFGANLSYHDYSNSFFQNGLDAGLFAQWVFSNDVELRGEVHYNDGAEGWYGNAQLAWSYELSSSSYFRVSGGVSAVSDYYDRNGWNDAFGRAEIVYYINPAVSITPFVGGSALLDSDDTDGDSFFGGVWFAVTF